MEWVTLLGFAVGVPMTVGAMIVMGLLIVRGAQAVVGTQHRQRIQTRAAWQEVAAERGWEQIGQKLEHQRVLTADGLQLEMRYRFERIVKPQYGWRAFVEGRVEGIAPPGTVTRHQPPNLLVGSSVGWPKFDRRANVQISDDHLARLGTAFQQAFVAACAVGFRPSIVAGDVVLRAPGRWISPKRLQQLADHTLVLAQSLGRGPIEDVLEHEIRSAGASGFRSRCLEQLGKRDPSRQRALALELAGCGDPDLEREAQVVLGDAPALLHALHDRPLLRSAGRRAVRAVLDHGNDVDRVDVLRHVAGTYPFAFARTELLALSERSVASWTAPAMFEVLEALGARPTEERALLAPVCIQVLGTVPATPAVEAVLQGLLDRFEIEVVVAAATALRSMGTVASVPALAARIETEGLFAGPHIEGACRQAISAIQGRTTGSAGDLSIAATTPAAGALSPARRAKSGALSEPRQPCPDDDVASGVRVQVDSATGVEVDLPALVEVGTLGPECTN